MRTMRLSLAGTLMLALLGGLGGVVAAQADDMTTGSAGCDAPLAEPGDYESINEVGDASENYWVVVPERYAEDAPLPLIIWLSSGVGDADANYAGWRTYLDDTGALFVVAGTARHGDPDTLLALMDRLEADYCIDQHRIHVMGESWSAWMVGRLACVASERVASFLGGMGGFSTGGCVPARPVPLLAITGETDRYAVSTSIEGWAESNGCEPEPVIEDLGSGVSRHTYQGCDADIVLFDVEGAGHAFIFHECIGPGAEFCRAYDEVDQLEEALAFFEQHPLPAE